MFTHMNYNFQILAKYSHEHGSIFSYMIYFYFLFYTVRKWIFFKGSTGAVVTAFFDQTLGHSWVINNGVDFTREWD